MSHRSYAVIGTGAIGGYYGACLQQAGLELHFLLHSDYQDVQEHGLIVESPKGNFTLPQVNAYQDAAQMPPCDVAIVALKATQNHLLPKILPAVVKDNGIVLLLQNGLGAEEKVAEILPSQQVIGGLCFICSNKVAPGHIRHLDYGNIKISEYTPNYQPCGITESMRQVASDLESAGIEIALGEDLLLTRWEKLVWNIPFNGLSVVLDTTTEQMMADQEVRLLAEQIMQEVALAAKTAGDRLISQTYIQNRLEYTAKMKPYRTSMKIDYDSQRPMEIEAILGNPLRAATAAGAHLPRIQMLYQQLKFLETKNRSD
ncbi:MAG: putative 2-dehydropantoate 2-reductase [Cyanobacteria bacterium QS_7_48_42]|jgi:2-dehydropantoate 2-reductase|nr:MAG: putative 2-dehydropantoate 2-reductase [Cyanobacteria bacterium QH_10_48_56]PSO63969.1 MAG: putative 2-dehydropantoate 2-reductase [Cyanobacteria bacterium QH_7_48_89]PSO67618.1 MAG: putative 2-dehydropantoate 2-reductase [Cyanobacteria bacterium QH_6_48_35]PSO69726.1 MAG: putative 2-dehydropantoate 2-reductase [Cyanobacteria bacterium QS_1_48_34]PSO70780.1 MAG: putative 2-dehydropantoate 2-reductase [Cyanobacteria bacterium QH_3_48_40]PSO78032.1 MAG: putative 2-dehydropantoate 2-reduc